VGAVQAANQGRGGLEVTGPLNRLRACCKKRHYAQDTGWQWLGAARRQVIPCFCAEPAKEQQKQLFGRLAADMTQVHDSVVDTGGCSSKGTLDEMSENLLGIIFLWVKVHA
jgi:hypothetical protein